MSISDLMGDEIYIQSPDGKQVGPVKAVVQRNQVIINDENLVIEEGGKILRPLPSGKSEAYTILEVIFHKDPFGGDISHYEIITRRIHPWFRLPVIQQSILRAPMGFRLTIIMYRI